jgi:hypothetical protein
MMKSPLEEGVHIYPSEEGQAPVPSRLDLARQRACRRNLEPIAVWRKNANGLLWDLTPTNKRNRDKVKKIR